MIVLDLSILNQKGTPMFYSDTLAARPAAGIVGRIFIAIDAPYGIYRDTGSAWDQISGASTFSGSLATGQVAFGSATNTISGTNNLFWDNANGRLSIGTNSTTNNLEVVGTSSISSIGLTSGTKNGYVRLFGAASLFSIGHTGNDQMTLETNSNARIFIFGGGNVLVGSTGVDTGQRFQVQGTTLLNGVTSILSIAGNSTIAESATFNADINDFVITGGRGNNQAGSLIVSTTISNFSTNFSGTKHLINIAGNFAPGASATGNVSLLGINSIINYPVGATGIQRSIYVNPTLTRVTDYRSIEWSNNTGWGLYGAGTALNYLGGTLGIKTTSPYAPSTFSLDVNGGLLVKNTAGTTAQITLINADPSIGGNNGFLVASVGGTSGGSYVDFQGYYGTSVVGSTALRLNPAGGAVIVNSTTNTGEQFQLTGTLRINGQSSGTSGGNSGQHLIINLDGTTYKIKLELP